MKPSFLFLSVVVASLSVLTFAQVNPHPSPCEFTGEVLQNNKGEPVWFNSDQMKKRANHKVDVSAFLKQVDIKSTAIVDVLVNSSGGVVCVKSLAGHPMSQVEVEKALQKWTFRPAKHNGHAVAYLGEIQFLLCNISCGDQGPSMTLLK